MATAAEKKPAQPAKEYVHVVMAHHPVHGTKIPISTHATEEEAYAAAAKGNEKYSQLGYHVKKVVKGG